MTFKVYFEELRQKFGHGVTPPPLLLGFTVVSDCEYCTVVCSQVWCQSAFQSVSSPTHTDCEGWRSLAGSTLFLFLSGLMTDGSFYANSQNRSDLSVRYTREDLPLRPDLANFFFHFILILNSCWSTGFKSCNY
jgi:hypothetical protein